MTTEHLQREIEGIELRLFDANEAVNSFTKPEDAALAAGAIHYANNIETELQEARQQLKAAIIDQAPHPLPLMPDIGKPHPYPVDALPAIIRDAVYAIAETAKAPTALAGQCVIGAAVYLALTRADAENATGGQMPISTAMLSLADSGDRKSTCHKLAFLPIGSQQQDLAREQARQLKAYNDGMKGLKGKALKEYQDSNDIPPDTTTIYSDVTFERIAGDLISGKSVVFWDTDEGGQMLGGSSLKADTKVATIGGMTKLLDDGSVARMRSRSNVEASGSVFNRRFTIHLMAQDIAVQEALRDPLLRGQGFLPRFLLTAPASLKGTRTLTPDEYAKQRERTNSDRRLKRYWARISELMDTQEYIDPDTSEVTPPVMALTQGAHNLWLELYNETEIESDRFGELGQISAFASRVGDQARKIATALAVFEKLDHVDADCMRSAIALVKHSVSEWLRHTAGATVDKDLQDAATVMDWLAAPERVHRWAEFNRDQFGKSGFKPFRTAAKRDAVLATLVQNHHLLTTDGRTFIINPRINQPQGSAETAETAETQQTRGAVSAEQVRTSAETANDKTQSAPIRTVSAPANPAITGQSAVSAQSAPIGAPVEKEQGELIL
ncbi:MAG: DUF3987 domain-containing protein [Pseudomonas sp.]|nr:DUF3987 domain-containing protein [Pseudomonas sp.]